MTIAEGLRTLHGSAMEIPDVSRDELPEFWKQRGYKVGAEVGVASGDFSEVIAKSGLYLYAVDSWPETPRYEAEYQKTVDRLKPYDAKVIRKTSMEAYRDFRGACLDFVYIDANHAFPFVAEDVFWWSKRVKSGGCIAGHDYWYYKTNSKNTHRWDVPYVLEAYTKCFDIKDWYILGEKKAQPGHKRDSRRSWMWIKP